MNDRWSFHNPVQVRFGAGAAWSELAAVPGERLLLVTTAGMTKRGVAQKLVEATQGRVTEIYDQVTPNPEMHRLDELIAGYRAAGFDGIVALGGGSAIDTAKVLGLMLGASDGLRLRDHFLDRRPLVVGRRVPVTAIPTTAGTGSEVTPFATVWHDGPVRKYSLADPGMFPALAVLDPDLTLGLPWEVTLSSGLDALCQAFESLWNRRANPITTSFALQAAKLAWPWLQSGRQLLEVSAARADLLMASLLAGLAISETRTALCHSMSYPVTAHFGLPHGLACAFTMPAVLRFNGPADDGRLMEVARQLGFESIEQLAKGMEALLQQCRLADHLVACGLTRQSLQHLVPQMQDPSRAGNNLRSGGPEDLHAILTESCDWLGLK